MGKIIALKRDEDVVTLEIDNKLIFETVNGNEEMKVYNTYDEAEEAFRELSNSYIEQGYLSEEKPAFENSLQKKVSVYRKGNELFIVPHVQDKNRKSKEEDYAVKPVFKSKDSDISGLIIQAFEKSGLVDQKPSIDEKFSFKDIDAGYTPLKYEESQFVDDDFIKDLDYCQIIIENNKYGFFPQKCAGYGFSGSSMPRTLY